MRRTSKESILKAEFSHIESRLSESNTVSTRNESTQSKSIWNRDQSSTLSARFIFDKSIEAKNADKINSDSDITGSENSVTSRESCSITRNSQSMLSIRYAKNTASSRRLERDIKYSLLQLADSISRFVKSVQYEIWNSRPQFSKLTKVEPELRSFSWTTVSHYDSLSDLFVSMWLWISARVRLGLILMSNVAFMRCKMNKNTWHFSQRPAFGILYGDLIDIFREIAILSSLMLIQIQILVQKPLFHPQIYSQ